MIFIKEVKAQGFSDRIKPLTIDDWKILPRGAIVILDNSKWFVVQNSGNGLLKLIMVSHPSVTRSVKFGNVQLYLK